LVPFHVWLPEAHTEAPTIGSVLLAAVLLKLGSYGMLKFLFVLLPVVTKFYMPNILLICLLGMFYISLTAIRQIDAKKVIAYSSVAHMSYVVAGALFASYLSHVGSVFLMFGHGLVSAGLFFCVGFLYERSKTRIIKYYGGIASISPILTFSFLFLTFANTAFPGTCNFVGELLVLLAMCEENIFITAVATFAIVFGSVYSI
jgi:NADH:ubiquinone oxidoreductase subunit 4 (subunit M)